MAMFVEGITCSLCGKPMQKSKGQEITCFRPFVSNQMDPLWQFSDNCVHSACFDRHPLAGAVMARLKERDERIPVWPPPCHICGRTIASPDDHFTFGHLTEDDNHPLHQYNYVQLHLSCMKQWPALSSIYQLLKDLENSGTWKGPGLTWMLQEMGKLRRAP